MYRLVFFPRFWTIRGFRVGQFGSGGTKWHDARQNWVLHLMWHKMGMNPRHKSSCLRIRYQHTKKKRVPLFELLSSRVNEQSHSWLIFKYPFLWVRWSGICLRKFTIIWVFLPIGDPQNHEFQNSLRWSNFGRFGGNLMKPPYRLIRYVGICRHTLDLTRTSEVKPGSNRLGFAGSKNRVGLTDSLQCDETKQHRCWWCWLGRLHLCLIVFLHNVNPGLINHGLLIRGVLLQ